MEKMGFYCSFSVTALKFYITAGGEVGISQIKVLVCIQLSPSSTGVGVTAWGLRKSASPQ